MEKADFQALSSFFAQFQTLHYKKGEVILRPQQVLTGVYYLAKGYTRVYAISPEGEEFTLVIFQPEDFFPVIWALNDAQNHYYLEALTPVELIKAPKKDFIKLLENNPPVLMEICKKIVTRMGGALNRMEHLVFGNAYNKVVNVIILCAERFGEKSGNGFKIPFPMAHRVVANLAGITRETASLEIKKLERSGLLEFQGRYIEILNLEKLKKESSFY